MATKVGWLIDPRNQRVTIYCPGAAPLHIAGDMVHRSGPVEAFTLNVEKSGAFTSHSFASGATALDC